MVELIQFKLIGLTFLDDVADRQAESARNPGTGEILLFLFKNIPVGIFMPEPLNLFYTCNPCVPTRGIQQ